MNLKARLIKLKPWRTCLECGRRYWLRPWAPDIWCNKLCGPRCRKLWLKF